MSAPQPDRVMLRAVAEVMFEEEKARSAADAVIAADLVRIRERLDDYGNVINTKFLGLEHAVRDQVAAEVAKAAIAEGDAVVAEQKARADADRELGAELERCRERLDEYGNVIDTRFLSLEHRMRDQVAAYVASLELKDGAPGAPGERGEQGERGEVGDRGERGDPGERGEPGPAGYVGRACGRFDPTASYRAMDVVAMNGSEWRAIKDDPGPVPGEGWMLGAKGQKGDKGAPGERGDRGDRGPPGPPGIGISDIVIDNGVLVIVLTNGKSHEFALEAAA